MQDTRGIKIQGGEWSLHSSGDKEVPPPPWVGGGTCGCQVNCSYSRCDYDCIYIDNTAGTSGTVWVVIQINRLYIKNFQSKIIHALSCFQLVFTEILESCHPLLGQQWCCPSIISDKFTSDHWLNYVWILIKVHSEKQRPVMIYLRTISVLAPLAWMSWVSSW